MLERVPGLGLVFDTANMLPHGDDTLTYYEALKEHRENLARHLAALG